MDKINIEGVFLSKLKIIDHPKGNIYHAMKKTDHGFNHFGEAYFSTILKNEVKGWKKNIKMTLNLIVPIGEVTFVLFDDRKTSITFNKKKSIKISPSNYYRLTIPPKIWYAFKGHCSASNLILNIIDHEHQSDYIIKERLDTFQFDWEKI
mgnify:CR=1 FL=1|tara:strand:- start:1078 stop:1527 length:450 start_codon:yes stop_codon:yes gene_type:complete